VRWTRVAKRWSPAHCYRPPIYLSSVVCTWDMDTFILTFLLIVIINNVILYLWFRKNQRTPSTNLQLDSKQGETDTGREIPPPSDSEKAGKGEQVKISELSTALIPSNESMSCVPHDSETCPPSSNPSSVPPPVPPRIVSYHEIISAVTRCVHV
jgi:hypothetical protein